MNLESSLTCIALASIAIACSGSTQIGESSTGDGGSSGSVSSGGIGGSSAGGVGSTTTSTTGNGSGGTGASAVTSSSGGASTSTGGASTAAGGSGGNEANPCDGRPCGASCSNCAGDMNCAPASDMFCNEQGQCVTQYPTCEPGQCQTATDCPQPGAPCQQCADGSVACPIVDCIAGECVGSFPTCPTTCNTDADCPVSLGACQLCEDGTAACPRSECRDGACVSGIEPCADQDPCEGKQCGDTCSACDPASADCNAVLMYCNEELECQPNQPTCSAIACDNDDECPLVGACPVCADGTTCAEMRCVSGACQFQCPEDTGCGEAGDSCAGGGACCSGLICCAGVPIPEGEEYCSASDCPDSDVNIKRDFAAVNPDVILERLATLPISTWSYRAEPSAKHIGPMAQDFMATFNVGASDRAIAKVDADGVAFAAIQALYGRLQALETQNARLERKLSTMTDCAYSQNLADPGAAVQR